MRARIAKTGALFGIAAVATALLGRWCPSSLSGPASALIVAGLGLVLFILAPGAEAAGHSERAPVPLAGAPPAPPLLPGSPGERERPRQPEGGAA